MTERTVTDRTPIILTLAGMEQPGPGHWLSRWNEELPDCQPVALGLWANPNRNAWVTALNIAIREADRPVVLVARGLACHAVAWWAALERPAYGTPVAGAMLVAPPRIDTASDDLRYIGFGPAAKVLLPFPSVVVASRNDHRMDYAGAQSLARLWGSHCVDGGEIGSANDAADLGRWTHGRTILHWLTAQDGEGLAAAPRGAAEIIGFPGRTARPIDLSL
ncbi:RBBP9/YdeN family alpha/beta hydrolase [Sphingobium aquiterrae]|uniref:RBBP9/YdeN family alpha/beta hydrolase n=1 Tax=Sphingobium aquiterrae TaxID=2038656 RepID=UPI0030197059